MVRKAPHAPENVVTADHRAASTDDSVNPLDQRICDVVAACPNAEELFEEWGVDYWFGWERDLRSACKAANVDAEELVAHLVRSAGSSGGQLAPKLLMTVLENLEQHTTVEILPAIEQAFGKVDALLGERRERLRTLLARIRVRVQSHDELSRELLAVASAIDQKKPDAFVDPSLIRLIRLDHLELAEMSRQLVDETAILATSVEAAPVVTALRQVALVIHRHIKDAYNSVLPRFTAAATSRPVASEPW